MSYIFNPQTIHLYQPPPSSHKGQNGKLLVIGGSELFHSSIFWAADVASRIVDIVHLTSPANENNLVFRRRLKEKFWSGIVVDWGEVEGYIGEDDCVLIGPGMVRDQNTQKTLKAGKSDIPRQSENLNLRFSDDQNLRFSEFSEFSELKTAGENDRTSVIVNTLLKKYPTKKWVIDGGGLQEVNPGLITKSCILTPHRRELNILMEKFSIFNFQFSMNLQLDNLTIEDQVKLIAKKLGCTILLKGQVDIVCQGDKCTRIIGGNAGMTKGGTGDVLAGLVAGFYCKNDSWTAATVGSWVNKKAGDNLYKKVGPYFNAGDLVGEIPKVLRGISELE